MKKKITRDDILPMEIYSKLRQEKRAELVALKKKRKVSIGPDALLIFENYDTIWFQVHEMLYIEKGGEEQIEEELAAYNPLIPQGRELVFTFMLEIEDADRRRHVLGELGHIEEKIFLRFGPRHIRAFSKEETIARTTPQGKTSAVHFLYFPFKDSEVTDFKKTNADIILEIDHPNYRHKALLPEAVRQHLAGDLE